MICMRLRRSRISALEILMMSLSSNRISPSVGSIRRRIVRPSVDLPQPDSPTTPSVSPSSTVRLTPSTALTSPLRRASSPSSTGKYFFRFLISSKLMGSVVLSEASR